jgi:hypothetical protein
MAQIRFKPPGPVARAFMRSDAFVRGIRGPFGSAKSSCCVMECFRRANSQEPGPDGVRRSKGAVIRNTYAELRDTTIRTWTNWLPSETFGEIAMHPPPFRLEMNYNDVECEVLFMALDREEDVKKLLSLELTWAWINEAREVPKAIVDAVTGRLRRYPAIKDGGATWSGLIMDTNSPDDDHWWSIMSGDSPPPEHMTAEERLMLVRPVNWDFFTQPPAMLEQVDAKGNVTGYELNTEAENLKNLDPLYYPELITGKTRNWIDVYVLNRIGADFDGKKVHPHFRREVHVSREALPIFAGHPVHVGYDFGLTPSAIFSQFVGGQWLVQREIVLENAGANELGRQVVRLLASDYPDHKKERVLGHGDPAGDKRVDTDKTTPYQILRAAGLRANPVETNDPEIRRGALSVPLQRMTEGRPGILFDPSCVITVKGLDGGWHYRRIGNRYSDEPEKNRFSHPCEALEYGLMGGGEGREMRGRSRDPGKPANARVAFDPFRRMQRAGARR